MDIVPNQEGGSAIPSPNGQAAAAGSALNKMRARSHGGARVGSGRPKGGGVPQGAPRTSSAPPLAPEPVASPEDIEFCRQTARQGLKLLDKLVCSRIENAVNSIDNSFGELALKISGNVEISEEEVKFVSDTVAALAAKYAVMSQYAPEIAMGSWAASYGVRVKGALDEIRDLSSAVIKMRGEQKK